MTTEAAPYFDDTSRAAVAAALDAVVPGASDLGGVDYVEQLLTALDHEPPRIWAAPADSGTDWLELGPWEREAWAQRIAGWRAAYARIAAGEPTDADRQLLRDHAAEAAYGDPAYGGNRDTAAWTRIGFPAPMFPPSRPPS